MIHINSPAPEARPEDISIVRQHWSNLAAVAWEGYSCLGRGIVVVEYDSNGHPSLAYIDEALIQATREWSDLRIRTALSTYNPRCEVLCLVVRPNQTMMFYRAGRAMQSPPRAYAAYQSVRHPLVP